MIPRAAFENPLLLLETVRIPEACVSQLDAVKPH